MKNNSTKKLLSLLLCIVLIAAMALFTTGCGDSSTETSPVTTEAVETAAANMADSNILGEGSTVFTVVITDLEGVETTYEVHTDATTVGEALLALGLLDGEQGDYGLYITEVNGIPLKWENDGKYWAFYIDGEYAMSGVDTIEVTAGATYSFKPE